MAGRGPRELRGVDLGVYDLEVLGVKSLERTGTEAVVEGHSWCSDPKDQLKLRIIHTRLYVWILLFQYNLSEEESPGAAVHLNAWALQRATRGPALLRHVHVHSIISACTSHS